MQNCCVSPCRRTARRVLALVVRRWNVGQAANNDCVKDSEYVYEERNSMSEAYKKREWVLEEPARKLTLGLEAQLAKLELERKEGCRRQVWMCLCWEC